MSGNASGKSEAWKGRTEWPASFGARSRFPGSRWTPIWRPWGSSSATRPRCAPNWSSMPATLPAPWPSSMPPKRCRQHTAIIALFVEFICWQTDVQRFEEITRGMANSAFRHWYQRKVGDRTESELKTAVRKFFQFLAVEKGVRNEAVLKSLQR